MLHVKNIILHINSLLNVSIVYKINTSVKKYVKNEEVMLFRIKPVPFGI